MKPPCAARPLTIAPIACSRTPKCRLRPARLQPPPSEPSLSWPGASGGLKSPWPLSAVKVDGSRSAEPPTSAGSFGAIVNGLAAHGGFIGYGSTFLIFSDYMRPPIRLAALMGLHVVHVFTHDSLALGEDGPTHQPIEQLASLRAIPKLTVIRPGDANETAVAWKVAIETRDRPVLLSLTRQNVATLDRGKYASAEGLRRGAYVLSDATDAVPRLILMASGSEVGLVVAAAERLRSDGVAVRVVSMPSWDLFEMQPKSYRDEVLPPQVTARLSVELGVEQGWDRYVGDRGDTLAIDGFGASAPAEVLLDKYGFTVDNVVARARKLLPN